MAKGMRRDRKKEAEWRGHLRAQRRSGQSVRGYCEEHGLSEPSFYHWKREVARRDAEGRWGRDGERQPDRDRRRPAVAFAEIKVTDKDRGGVQPATQSGDSAIEVALAGERRILLRSGFDAATFLRVVALLEGRPSC